VPANDKIVVKGNIEGGRVELIPVGTPSPRHCKNIGVHVTADGVLVISGRGKKSTDDGWKFKCEEETVEEVRIQMPGLKKKAKEGTVTIYSGQMQPHENK